MGNAGRMKPERKTTLKSFLIELVIYAVLVLAYFFVVLHFMGGWLERIFIEERKTYAFLALILMVGQGFLLEAVTTSLLRAIQRKGSRR
jgi:hypothetical protein